MIPAASVARRLRRHWALAVVCAAFLPAGALALGNYHDTLDNWTTRAIGNAALDYLAGDGERAINALQHHDEYYGAVVETPLVLLERALAVDWRDSERARHIPLHLLFLAGGACCYLLVLRLFGSRRLALVAMVLFLLHPRIYAHSFFNSKDVPFLVAFMVSLSLIHRAFRRETLGSFILCGVGVGLLINLRVMGIVLFAAVLALRGLDLLVAGSADGRKRALLTGGGFALAAMLTYHASLPVLWTDPSGRFADLLGTLSAHGNAAYPLFRGEHFFSVDGPPWDYVPVWVAITTPPATLLLAAGGAVALAWRALASPRDSLRHGPVRFGLLLIALPVVVAVAVVVLENNLTERHMYFLYAPLFLLAVYGIHGITRFAGGRWPRAGAYVLAVAAIAVAVVSMARIHPHERLYFTLLTDRTTPGRLASTWGVERWPPQERRSGERDFHGAHHDQWCPALPGARVSRLYSVLLHCVVDPAAYLGGYRREALAGKPLDRSRFDAYRVDDVMVYVRDGCSRGDLEARIFLRVYPVDAADLPNRLRQFSGHRTSYGFEKHDFDFRRYGARIDGDCVAAAPLPAYPIARIETGQYTPEYGEAARRAVANVEPRVRSRFDVWLAADERVLTYVREGCTAEDMAARFRLHVHPIDADDLVADWRTAHGFDNRSFSFKEHGVRLPDGACVATVPLPVYPIATIHTGQFTDEGSRWDARFAFSPPEADPAVLAREPLARSAFDVWLDGGALVYVKDGCTAEDAAAPFFLHVHPVDADDLPDARREHGFDNRDFLLWQRGGESGGRCVAMTALPDWPIAAIRTGQYDATGDLWAVEFALPE